MQLNVANHVVYSAHWQTVGTVKDGYLASIKASAFGGTGTTGGTAWGTTAGTSGGTSGGSARARGGLRPAVRPPAGAGRVGLDLRRDMITRTSHQPWPTGAMKSSTLQIRGRAYSPSSCNSIDKKFQAVHAMHVGAGWITVIALLGAAVLMLTLPAVGKQKNPTPEPDYEEALIAEDKV